MNEFLIAIHRDLSSKYPSPGPEQMKESVTEYEEWVNGIAKRDRLLALPRNWDDGGRVISTAAKVHVGPYAEGVISIGGVILVRARDYDDAVEMARQCPMIRYGAIVEVRMALPAA